MKRYTVNLGLIGEYFLLYELARRGINGLKMPDYLNFDLLLKNGIRIEVKTSTIQLDVSKKYKEAKNPISSKREIYCFHIRKNQKECDVFVLIGLNKNLNVDRLFIIPKEIIGNRKCISIPINSKKTHHRYGDYENRWDIITTDGNNI